MQRPAYSSVLSGGRVCGKRRAWTCLAISISCAARRSVSSLSARARRWASTAWVTSSKLTSEKELPSRSLKRVKTPPRSEEHTSELQSQSNLVCRLLLEKKKTHEIITIHLKCKHNTAL